MAGVLCIGCCSAVCFLTILYTCQAVEVFPTFNSVRVLNKTITENNNDMLFFKLEVEGKHLSSNMKVRATSHQSLCTGKQNKFGDDESSFSVDWLNSNYSKSVMTGWLKSVNGASENNVYLCVKSDPRTSPSEGSKKSLGKKLISTLESSGDTIKWVHQGESVFFRTKESYLNPSALHESRSVYITVHFYNDFSEMEQFRSEDIVNLLYYKVRQYHKSLSY